ncbi:MAG: LpxD N-terminal domain-containing protein, partial [Opitutales bacterium]
MRIELTLTEILKALPEGSLEGESSQPSITGIAALDQARSGDLAFLGNPKYRAQVPACAASLVLLPKDYDGTPKDGQAYLRVDDPSRALANLCGI